MSQANLKSFRRKNYFSIPCFYDSHLHLDGIGKYQKKNSISHLQNLNEFQDYVSKSQKSSNALIEAFGLKNNLLDDKDKVEQIFKISNKSKKNFYLVFEDGHQLFFHGPWAHEFKQEFKTDILKLKNPDLINFLGRDNSQTLLLDDKNRFLFDRYFIEKRTKFKSTESNLLLAQKLLLSKGITHCRDLTSDLSQVHELQLMASKEVYKIQTETFFSDFYGDSISSLIKSSSAATKYLKTQKTKVSVPAIEHKGIKVFLDGTFSQNTVDLLCAHDHPTSHTKYTIRDLVKILKQVSDNNLEIAFHTMGDGAVEKVIMAFDKIKNEFKTKVHLEHCELIHPKTMNYLIALDSKFKNQLRFHFQPSHYLLDQEKILEIKKKDSKIHVFPWHLLLKNGFMVCFGSDAPVTEPGIGFSLQEKFIQFFNSKEEAKHFWPLFVHPDYKLNPSTFSVFKNNSLCSVFINGEKMRH